jgi:hypothetical protein
MPLFAFALCAAGATLSACRTTYEPTTPRPVRVGDVEASIERLQGRSVAEVRVRDVSPSNDAVLVLRGIRLGKMDQRPCASNAPTLEPPTPLRLRSNESIEVALPPSIDALAQRGVTLDLAFGDGASGCARLPVTATGDETLWRGLPGLGGSGHLAIEWPMASAGGIGAGFTAEMRFHYPVRFGGDWRLALGVPFGWGGCRGDCPALGWHLDDNGSLVTGIFTHIGATASVARAIALGRWLFLPALGARTSVYLLAPSSAYEGDRFLAAGPFVSLGVLRTYRDSPPGFAPSPTWRRGVELTLSALRAYGRSPEGTAWLLGVGWTFIDGD